ncbi:hypothetical protein, partial [Rhodococcus jostii]|uniref:hypothetical protein n=1 Tax=Rhodococcus jostii TaxID=132919 RepID=UPI0036544E6B
GIERDGTELGTSHGVSLSADAIASATVGDATSSSGGDDPGILPSLGGVGQLAADAISTIGNH